MHIARAIIFGFALIAAASTKGKAEGDSIEFDPLFRTTMMRYASVDRYDGKTYRLYINQVALSIWRSERQLPTGTMFAIESFLAEAGEDGEPVRTENGRLVPGESEKDVHIAMKSDRWTQELPITTNGLLFGDQTANGTWRMAGFDPRDGAATPGLNIAECHACHLDHRAEDFVLSRGLLDRFARTGAPAYISFTCAEREICFGTPREN